MARRRTKAERIRVSPMLWLLILASGAAAVALEVLWIRDFALWFGSTAAAAAVVLSVYFAGLALGARLGGRLGRRDPLRTYALLETGVALSVVCYVAARPWLPLAAAWLAHATAAPALPLARTLLATAVLLVPTSLLGATLPVVAAAMADAAGAARLYACNTLGGAAGALATGFVALPALGARGAFLAAATVDVGVALVARTLTTPSYPRSDSPAAARARAPSAAIAAVAGGVALAAEVLWMRGLSGVLSASVYSVTLVLAATLCGIVAGSAAAVRALRHPGRATARLAGAAGLGALTLVLSLATLRALPSMRIALARAAATPAAGLAAEALLALVVVFVPSAAIGAILPLTLDAQDARDPGRALSGPLAANTLA